LVAAIFYLGLWIDSPVVPELARYVLWPVYWYVQGSVMTGIWVLAHECGHQAFSDYEWVNNLVGTVLHSFLLVPYHSWRITHGKHHNNTGSTENDEVLDLLRKCEFHFVISAHYSSCACLQVFCPATRSDFEGHHLRETPLQNLWGIVIMLVVGWPGYLVLNVTGPAKYRYAACGRKEAWRLDGFWFDTARILLVIII
jgi:omega-6 fatty acid desaturase (delta-12 desaturase)